MSKEISTNQPSYHVPVRSTFSSPVVRRLKRGPASPGRVPVVGAPVKEYVQPQNDMSWRGQIEKFDLDELTASKIYDLVLTSGSRLVIIVDTEGNPIKLRNEELIVPSGTTITPTPETLHSEDANGIDDENELSDSNPPDEIPALKKNSAEEVVIPSLAPLEDADKNLLRKVFEKKVRVMIVDTDGNPISLRNEELIVPSGTTIIPTPETLDDEDSNGIDDENELSDSNPPDEIPALKKNSAEEVVIPPLAPLEDADKNPLRKVFEKKVRVPRVPPTPISTKKESPEEIAVKKKEKFEQTNYFLSLSPERQEQLKKQHKKTGIPMEVLVQRPEKRPPRNVQVMQRDVEDAINSQYAAINTQVGEPTESSPL